MKNLPESIRQIVNSVAPLLVVVVLFVVVGKFGIAKVSDIRTQIAAAQKDNVILTQKLALLETIAGTVGTSSSISAGALPDKNPSLVVLSQLKVHASQNGVTISSIKGGGEAKDTSGLSKADISFDVTGARPQIISFLNGVSQFAPITLVDKIRLSENGSLSRASVSVRAFFAPFPTKLPALPDQISDLTADEKSTLAKASALIQPLFLEVPAAEGGGKSDPFAP